MTKLSKLWVVNTETKEKINLLELSIKNEKNRLAAMYLKAKTFERLAQEINLVWMFVTLTAPPEYHPNPAKGKNSYNKELGIKASHEYIQKQWQRIRSSLAINGIKASPETMFGFHTIEPHKDGSFHRHVLIFLKKCYIEEVSSTIREKFPGKYQAKIVLGHKGKGSASAASYLYKYLTKSFAVTANSTTISSDAREDAQREDQDLASMRNAARVQAAIKSIRARQYQTFGVARLNTIFEKINKLRLDDIQIEPDTELDYVKRFIWRNPDGFLNMLKKPEIFLAGGSIRLIREEFLNAYGEPTKKIVGLAIGIRLFRNDKLFKITSG